MTFGPRLRSFTLGSLSVLLLVVVGCGVDPAEWEAETTADVTDGTDIADTDVADVDTDAPAEVVQLEPSLTLLYPLQGDVVFGEAVFSASATPDGATLTFTVDGETIGTDGEAPFAAAWSASSAATGPHTLEVRASWADSPELEASAEFYVDRSFPIVAFLEPGGLVTGPDAEGQLAVALTIEEDRCIRSAHVKLADSSREWRLEGPDWSDTIDVSNLEPGVYTLTAAVVDQAFHVGTDTQEFVVCDADRLACGGRCVTDDFFSDAITHCGACNSACDFAGEQCVDAKCVCTDARSLCDGACVDLRIDEAHCGACGTACGGASECVNGACAAPVTEGFVAIPEGAFLMGAASPEVGAAGDEYPQHQVSLSQPFLLAQYEVTQADWRRFFAVDAATFWRCGDTCPVESVTWWEALAYTNALSEAEGLDACYQLGGCDDLPIGAGRSCNTVSVNAPDQDPLGCEGYRLPTEAEWEYAYRAGTTAMTYNGTFEDLDCERNANIDAIGWHTCNTNGPQPVGGLQPNAFGAYDMAGNVFEWVWDGWAPYSETPVTDPIGEPRSTRVIRGGGWNERADRLRAASRLGHISGATLPFLGFRVARSVQADR